MFAKGPMPKNYSGKRSLIEKYPEARCRRTTRMNITGYVVYLTKNDEEKDNGYLSRSTAVQAWEDACLKLGIEMC